MRGQKILGVGMLVAVTPWAMAFWTLARPPQAAPAPDAVPAYHRSAPTGPLPATLTAQQVSQIQGGNDPRVQAIYALAAKIKPVLYQQPCYCHCDRELGHHSLLDCFTGDHAAICATCLMEAAYVYQQTRAGKTAGQIRAGIERGEWQNVNLNQYLPSGQ